jgi:hypothetical protein
MSRLRRAASIAALLTASAPSAVMADPSVHMAWDDCGAAGSVTKAFACNTNVGAEQLYISFVPPAGATAFDALEGDIRLWAAGTSFPPPLPSYWGLNTGQCRQQSLTMSFFSSGPFTCANPWAATAAGGTAIDSSFASGFQTRIRFVAAVPTTDTQSLDPAIEYYGVRIVFSHRKSTGSGSCDGCSTPIGMELRSLRIYPTPNSPPYEYETGRSTGVFQTVNWQCQGAPILYQDRGWQIAGWDFPGCVTPAQRPTWGSIKSLYR